MKADYKLPKFESQPIVTSLSEMIGWNLKQTNVPETWKITKGEGQVVWVIDSGLSDHRDLEGSIIGGVNFVSNEGIEDRNGHETACCSIICAQENDMGIVGVAPDAKVFVVKALNESGAGEIPALYKALKFAVDVLSGQNSTVQKPSIISASFGSPEPFPDFIHNLIKTIHRYNVPIVCAAGNGGIKEGVNYPAAYPECLAIGAYDENGKITSFSAQGPQIDFAAPGIRVPSCWLSNTYREVRGTSFAAPFASGVIALLLAKHAKQEKEAGVNDCKTVKQIRQHLAKRAINGPMPAHSHAFGYGIIDPNAVLDDANTAPNIPDKAQIAAKKNKPWWKKLLGL